LGSRIRIFCWRTSSLSPSRRDNMVGTSAPRWRRLHQRQHPANRVSSRVHDSSDLSPLCIQYLSPMLSLVRPPITAQLFLWNSS
jgi:hypothetical protein